LNKNGLGHFINSQFASEIRKEANRWFAYRPGSDDMNDIQELGSKLFSAVCARKYCFFACESWTGENRYHMGKASLVCLGR